MRLLKAESNGELSLIEYYADIPPYAVLSHTWRHDLGEITMRDIYDQTWKQKPTCDKVRFLAEQSAKDGLQYFWMDTCCIDRASSADLQESVNSMFRWYQNAAKCYVFLADVSYDDDSEKLMNVFAKARWFTRGWTLQELLAPASVSFFSVDGMCLGTKHSLEADIFRITKIPVEALRGEALQSFSVDERLSWVAHRSTMREEDAVYSLLGLFNVFLPLIYGEGKQNAMRRLMAQIDSLIEEVYPRPATLFKDQALVPGECIRSASGIYECKLETDGNLVVRSRTKILWTNKLHHKRGPVTRLIMQEDGNLVVYAEGRPVWASKTRSSKQAFVIMQDDGNLVIYEDGRRPLWASNTGQGFVPYRF